MAVDSVTAAVTLTPASNSSLALPTHVGTQCCIGSGATSKPVRLDAVYTPVLVRTTAQDNATHLVYNLTFVRPQARLSASARS